MPDKCPLCYKEVAVDRHPNKHSFIFEHQPCGWFEFSAEALELIRENPKYSNNPEAINRLKAAILQANKADNLKPLEISGRNLAIIFGIDLGE